MAAINTVPKSIHLPLTNLTNTPRVLMCSASVGSEGSVTLQLRDTSTIEATTASTPTTTSATTTNGVTATASTIATSTLENALTIGYPDPEMLADVLGSIQTASLKNNHKTAAATGIAAAATAAISTTSTTSTTTTTTTNNRNNATTSTSTATVGTTTTTATTSTTIGNQLSNSNPNKITITRRNTSSSSISTNSASNSNNSVPQKITVQTVSTATNTNNIINSISNSICVGKTNTSYIKNCLIRSSSCSNTATNVTTLAQIMSNSSTSSASSILLNQHNTNSNCSNSSNFSNTSSVSSNCSSSSNDSASNSCSSNNSLTYKSNGKHVPANTNQTTTTTAASAASTTTTVRTATTATNTTTSALNQKSNTNSTTSSNSSSNNTNTNTTTIGICLPKKSRPKLNSPTRHGPQQCQICSKIFGNASALAKHKLTHSDERKYICALCSKAFKRQDHLNGHMMTHRNKKPYECKAEGCGKSYCDARSLRRHTENHHGGVLTPTNQSLSPTTANNVSSGNSSSVATSTLSLSPATASGDASSPDGATCIRTYISTGGTVVDASTGIALSDEQIKAMNLPIKTGVTLLSPTTSTSSTASSSSSSSTASSCGAMLAASSPTITLSDGATLEGEGLTREQLDLISKIMQQTKQTSAQVTVSSPTSVNSYKINTELASVPSQTRPRTWNMQLLNNSQNVTVTVEDRSNDIMNSSSSSPVEVKEEELSHQLVAAINPQLLNIVKIEKPVECNLCHRKFKNIPALNGHMRLHGGYFKKDPETKRNEKKDSNGPPLQTASIGVRALIEEKIISKRKDISKGAFVVPAPPGNAANNATTIRRSISDLESFLNPKANSNSIGQTVVSGTTTTVLPAATTIKSSNGLSIQQIGLPQSIEIFSGGGGNGSGAKQPKTLSLGSGANTITITTNNVPTTAGMNSLAALASGTSSKGSNTNDPKDSTLIELLKRGTRIAVTAKKSQLQSQSQQTQPSTNLFLSGSNGGEIATITTTQAGRQIITSNNRTAVIIPSDVQVVSTKSKLNNLGASSGGGTSTTTGNSTPTSISLPDGTPLSLTIAPSHEGNGGVGGGVGIGMGSGGSSMGGDVYTVTYTSDTGDLFDDTEVYNVSDTEMLLQTVDNMELLNDDDEAHIKSEHSDDFTLIKLEPENNCGHGNGQGNALPTFQQFHSKELIMQTSSQIQAIASMRTNSNTGNSNNGSSSLGLPVELKQQLGVLASPLHSPLAYPTPPSSHENVAQSSPFIEDGTAQFIDASHTFFGDKTDFSHVYFKTDEPIQVEEQDIEEEQLTDNEKILKLKSVLEESSFDASIKVEDLLNSTEDDAECDLREFAETNLSFLDEDQNQFLNDSRNTTSPLSESFFTTGIGSAEDVKQVLREVLPDEHMQLSSVTGAGNGGEQPTENIIDLYYLPGLGLQSQMMPNSEDPLLSSSPREFGQQRQMEQQQTTLYQQQQQQQQQQLLPQQPTIGAHADQQQTTTSNDFILPMVSGNNTNAATMQYSSVQQLPQSQFLDTTGSHQQSMGMTMTMQPLNNLMQPMLFSDKQEPNIVTLPTENVAQQQQQQQQQSSTTLTSSELVYVCNTSGVGGGTSGKPLLSTLPSMVTTPSASVTNLQPLSNQTNSILKRRLRPNGSQEAHNFSKFQTLSPHVSKLRKPSRTHYTPAPMLNPERKGIGLYCDVRKHLGQSMFDVFDDDDDFGDPVGLVDFSDESKVNLGSAYQAQIPACRPRDQATGQPQVADLMWDPSVQQDEKILMRYIDLSKSSAVPMGSHSEEVALQTLLQAQGNSAAAVLSLLQTQTNAFQMKWTASELEQFLRGLEKHGKDFAKIANKLNTKTSGECVQMYYFWKKLCVDYKVSHLKMEPVTPTTPIVEQKPYVCEINDCSASFSSKAALHGHVRIHAYGRNNSNNNNNNHSNQQHATSNSNNNTSNNSSSNNSSNNHNSNSISNNSSYACASHTNSISNNNNNHNNNNNNQNGSGNNNTSSIQATQQTHANNNNSNNNSNSNTNSNSNSNNNSNNNATNSTNQTKEPNNSNNANNSNSNANNAPTKDGDFPCKVCGKVFNKVKSRSAHMKTHRVQEPEQTNNQKHQQQLQQQQQQQHGSQIMSNVTASTTTTSSSSSSSTATASVTTAIA